MSIVAYALRSMLPSVSVPGGRLPTTLSTGRSIGRKERLCTRRIIAQVLRAAAARHSGAHCCYRLHSIRPTSQRFGSPDPWVVTSTMHFLSAIVAEYVTLSGDAETAFMSMNIDASVICAV